MLRWRRAARANGPEGSGSGTLQTERGNTTIADAVVTKVASIAAREVPGVYRLGGGVSRALGSVTQRVGIGDERSQGVSVEVGEREAAVDLTVTVEYGESIPQVSSGDPRERDQAYRGHHRPLGDRGQRGDQRPVLPRRRRAGPAGSRGVERRQCRRPRGTRARPTVCAWRASRSTRPWSCPTCWRPRPACTACT